MTTTTPKVHFSPCPLCEGALEPHEICHGHPPNTPCPWPGHAASMLVQVGEDRVRQIASDVFLAWHPKPDEHVKALGAEIQRLSELHDARMRELARADRDEWWRSIAGDIENRVRQLVCEEAPKVSLEISEARLRGIAEERMRDYATTYLEQKAREIAREVVAQNDERQSAIDKALFEGIDEERVEAEWQAKQDERMREIATQVYLSSTVHVQRVRELAREEIRAHGAEANTLEVERRVAEKNTRIRDEALEEAARLLAGKGLLNAQREIRALKSQPAAPTKNSPVTCGAEAEEVVRPELKSGARTASSATYTTSEPAARESDPLTFDARDHEALRRRLEEMTNQRDALRAGRADADREYKALHDLYHAQLLTIEAMERELRVERDLKSSQGTPAQASGSLDRGASRVLRDALREASDRAEALQKERDDLKKIVSQQGTAIAELHKRAEATRLRAEAAEKERDFARDESCDRTERLVQCNKANANIRSDLADLLKSIGGRTDTSDGGVSLAMREVERLQENANKLAIADRALKTISDVLNATDNHARKLRRIITELGKVGRQPRPMALDDGTCDPNHNCDALEEDFRDLKRGSIVLQKERDELRTKLEKAESALSQVNASRLKAEKALDEIAEHLKPSADPGVEHRGCIVEILKGTGRLGGGNGTGRGIGPDCVQQDAPQRPATDKARMDPSPASAVREFIDAYRILVNVLTHNCDRETFSRPAFIVASKRLSQASRSISMERIEKALRLLDSIERPGAVQVNSEDMGSNLGGRVLNPDRKEDQDFMRTAINVALADHTVCSDPSPKNIDAKHGARQEFAQAKRALERLHEHLKD